MSPVRILIFAKAPVAGQVKTRLIPALGAQGAARLARRMLEHTAEAAIAAQLGTVELCASPAADAPGWRGLALPPVLVWSEQGPGDLGERMSRAARRTLAAGERVLLIGTDCPALDPPTLIAAARALHDHDAVIARTADGGYALLGLARHADSLFADMPWSTAAVADLTVARIGRLGWSVRELGPLHDIDLPADLAQLPAGWLE